MVMGNEMNSSDAATGEVEQRVSAKYEGTAALTPCEPAQDKNVKINFKAKAKKRYQWQPSSSSNMLPPPPSPHHYSVSKKKKIKSSSFVRMVMGNEMNSSDAATGEVEQRVSAKYEGEAEQPEDISGVCPSYTIPPKIFLEFALATLFLLLAY
ncbi:hypothetical protein F2Q70_00012292 [Brassica cretica]|uniref:Uncharacterized protein n=1 Tax=Brassica cretica TaxID=69181 RepID=A0A8S9MA43_BRACR|nr:hypothetical protein F2Q70_00012292 [Brassica cretica]